MTKHVSITGATSGFGAELKKAFIQNEWIVSDFSRSTGHDLKSPIGRSLFVLAVNEQKPNVIILNTKAGQMDTLDELTASSWAASGRVLIVIGSRLTELGPAAPGGLHTAEKVALRVLSSYLAARAPGGLRIVHIAPGYIATDDDPRSQGMKGSEVVKTIMKLITDPDLKMIHDLTMFESESDAVDI